MFYHNAIDMLLLTDKLNLKYYVLYETKELLAIAKMYITIINILMFIVSSSINEVIRAVLNSLFFFTKFFRTHKKHKKHKNENMRISDFFPLFLCA